MEREHCVFQGEMGKTRMRHSKQMKMGHCIIRLKLRLYLQQRVEGQRGPTMGLGFQCAGFDYKGSYCHID